jgi:TATA-binding protein-associated factor Taf7
MSRSYRIKVRETLRRIIRASDHISSQLELLEILPPEQMAELLAKELTSGGFKRQGDQAVRKTKGVTITVDLADGTVTVQAESQQHVSLTSQKDGRAYGDDGGASAKQLEKQMRENLKASLEKDAARQQSELQKQVTDKLEGALADVRKELDRAVNRATAAALKVKASQMGQIKSLTEDPASGSLTIVVEV